jgi:hypothetical protein
MPSSAVIRWPGLLAGLAVLASATGWAGPQVFWASDPIRPGETVLLRGAGFGDAPAIEVARLDDGAAGQPGNNAPIWHSGGQKAGALQASDGSVKFTVPAALKPGVFIYRVSAGGAAVTGVLNLPALWWAQGDVGLRASPGGWLRLFGKNLAWDGSRTTVRLQGPKTVDLPATATADAATAYAANVALPKDLPVGQYQVFLHAGRGGVAGWSRPLQVTVEKPAAWPQTVFNVKDFGADGTGVGDATAAVEAALAKAKASGGGIVFFPRGRYQVKATLNIPRCTVLRGEREDWSCVFWPEVDTPPNSWLAGTNSFGLENLTLYCSNYKTFLTSDTQGDQAGDVFLRHVRVRANIYRGHIPPEEIDRRYREGLKVGFGGGYWLAALGGRNIEVSDCDLYSSSCVLSLTQPQGARIERNILGSGRWGGGGVFGGEGVIFDHNQYVGCDLTSWGAAGGLGYGNLSHVFIGHNSFYMENGGDREPITSDAPGGLYSGPLVGADATSITLPQPLKDTSPHWLGAAVYVVSGKGEGQWRKLAGFEGARVKVEPAWDVIPDTTSVVAIAFLMRQWLVVDNDFTDTGMAVQLYGAALEHICAGNRSTRTAGYHNFGMDYGGVEPSWFVQWLDNDILEGSIYRADHDNWRLSGDAHIGVYGLIGPQWRFPITLGTMIRRNHLRNNASIVLGTELPSGKVTPGQRTDPLVTDVVAEGNAISNSDVGVYVFQTTRGVWMAANEFKDVALKVWDEGIALRGDEARRKRLLASVGPIAAWDFDRATVDQAGLIARVPDTTGNGFDATGSAVTLSAEGRKGKAGQFTGTGYLSVDDAAAFNLQSVTVSLWVKPETIQGRHGLIGKRFAATEAPFILSLWDGGLEFEGTDTDGKWSFNFRSSAAMKAGEWQHVAAVVEAGKGVTIYRNGEVIGHTDNPGQHALNGEPLVIGREAWSGINMQQEPPSFFRGLMSEIKVWARALTADEVKAEAAR